MSAVRKSNLELVIEETEAFAREQRRIAEQFLGAIDEYLEKLAKIRAASHDVDQLELDSLDLTGVAPPFNAIKLLLAHVKRPLSRHQIVRILIAKGVLLGTEKEKTVNQSITMNVMLKKLKEPGFKPKGEDGKGTRKQDPSNLVGLPGWKESLFK